MPATIRQPRVTASADDLDALRTAVRTRSGLAIRYVRDVEPLREAVRAATGCLLSATTLKRFFGLVATDSNPALFTLNTLINYINGGGVLLGIIRQQPAGGG